MGKGKKNHKKYLQKKNLSKKQKKEKRMVALFVKDTKDHTYEKYSLDIKMPDLMNIKLNKEINQDNDANISNFNYIAKSFREDSDFKQNINMPNDNSFFEAFNNIFKQDPNSNDKTELNFDKKNSDEIWSASPHMLLYDCNEEKYKYKNCYTLNNNKMKDEDSLNFNYNHNNNKNDIKYYNYDNTSVIDSYNNDNDNNDDNNIDKNDNDNDDNNININSYDNNNNDNNIKNSNDLKFNINYFKQNQAYYRGIIANESPFIIPDSYLENHKENLRRLWEGDNSIFNNISELKIKNRRSAIYEDLYNHLAHNSRNKTKKIRKFCSDDMAEKIKTYLNKMIFEPFNTLFKDKINIKFQTKKSINNPKNDFNYVLLKIKLRYILSNDPDNCKAIKDIDINKTENKELIQYLDSTLEDCLEYFLFNKQDDKGMYNGKNVVDFLLGENERSRNSRRNIQDNETKKDYFASLLLLSYNLKRLFFLKSGRGFKHSS